MINLKEIVLSLKDIAIKYNITIKKDERDIFIIVNRGVKTSLIRVFEDKVDIYVEKGNKISLVDTYNYDLSKDTTDNFEKLLVEMLFSKDSFKGVSNKFEKNLKSFKKEFNFSFRKTKEIIRTEIINKYFGGSFNIDSVTFKDTKIMIFNLKSYNNKLCYSIKFNLKGLTDSKVNFLYNVSFFSNYNYSKILAFLGDTSNMNKFVKCYLDSKIKFKD